MWKLGSSFPGNVDIGWEILEFGGNHTIFNIKTCGKFSLLSSPACTCISVNETSSDSVLSPDFIFKI